MAASRQQSVKPSRNFMVAQWGGECAAYPAAAERRVRQLKVSQLRVGQLKVSHGA
jgi:hypothetical protein